MKIPTENPTKSSVGDNSTVTIKIDGLKVILIVDGRETVRIFKTPESAGACYDEFKNRIIKAQSI